MLANLFSGNAPEARNLLLFPSEESGAEEKQQPKGFQPLFQAISFKLIVASEPSISLLGLRDTALLLVSFPCGVIIIKCSKEGEEEEAGRKAPTAVD